MKRNLNPYVNCLHTGIGGHCRENMEVFVTEVVAGALRGRGSTGQYVQKLELNGEGVTNTPTSVEKDNLILEKKLIPLGVDKDGAAKTFLAGYYKFYGATLFRQSGASGTSVMEQYKDGGTIVLVRIRRLTPREAFRLMDMDECNIDKIMSAGISNTQMYKMAGNSIVVEPMYRIFRNLFTPENSDNEEYTLF